MRFFLLLLFVLPSLTLWADPKPELKFVENKNQWAPDVHFISNIQGGKMLVGSGKFSYYFIDGEHLEALHEQAHSAGGVQNESDGSTFIKGHAINVSFVGSNTNATPSAFCKSSVYYNYFVGSDPSHWASQAYAYDGIYYENLYEDISLKVYSVGNNAKYDLAVGPNGDPTQISIRYDGAEKITIENGNLYATMPLGKIIEKKPYAFQFINGNQKEVEVEFVLTGNDVSFHFPNGYDACYPLTIDPLLIFSTYSGSTADNWGSTATPGERGTLYSAGVTNESTFGGKFPATAGAFQVAYGGIYDIGILKYDSTGRNLLYASFIGGSNSEIAHSLVMNKFNELIVLGTTSSTDFPSTENAYDRSFTGGVKHESKVVPYDEGSDIFIGRISADGTQLLSSTFLGGTSNDGLNSSIGILARNYGDEFRGDIITDDDGSVYVSTTTASDDFPVTSAFDNTYNGNTDALIFKMNRDLSTLVWATFLGGNGEDASHSIKLDNQGDLFIAGGTTSSNFPIQPSAFQASRAGDADGWIVKLSKNGDQIYHATFTGTASFDQIYFLDLNEAGDVYVYGQTASSTFPVSPATIYNNPGSGQFVQKFSADLSSRIFSTVFGSGSGIPDISPTAFLVNDCNNLYMTGWGGDVNRNTGNWNSNTFGMPVTDDAIQKTTFGSDFYFIVLTDDASEFLYGTYLGGSNSKTHVDGGTSRFDKGGVVYHAVCSGCKAFNSTGFATSDFPTTAGAWSNTNNSPNCNNAAFKFDLSSLKARLQTNSLKLDMPGLKQVCLPDPIVFQNFSTGGETFEWDFGDGTKTSTSDTARIVHQYKNIGSYSVWLTAIDPGTCIGRDRTFTIVNVYNAEATIQGDDDMCENTSYTLKASGGAKYAWQSEDGTFKSSLPTPEVSPADTSVYYIAVTERNGCVHKDTVQLNVIPVIKPDFQISRLADCFSTPGVTVKNLTDSLKAGDQMFFDYGDGTQDEKTDAQHKYEKDGLYNVKLVGVREFCVTEKIVPLPFFTLTVPNIITPGDANGKNDKLTIQFGNTQGTTPADYNYTTSLIVYNRWGKKVYENKDYQYNWSGENLAGGIYYIDVTVQDHATCKTWLHIVKD